MKITPVAGSQAPTTPLDGATVNPSRLARAKAIAEGKNPEEIVQDTASPDPQAFQHPLKRIKLRTQVSPDRHLRPEEQAPSPEQAAPEGVAPQSAPALDAAPATTDPQAPLQRDTLDPNESTQAVSEETKPLSPQFAALAKQKRALQLKEQELLAKEKALEGTTHSQKALEEYRARIKANALRVLQEEGVTYDQLTEQILASSHENADLSGIRSELQALTQSLEEQKKSMTESEARAEKQVLAQLQRDADHLISQGDDYEMIREAGYSEKVVELIHKTFKATGEYLDVKEAANLIENELLEDFLKFSKIKKVQSRMNPATPSQTQPVQTDRGANRPMRTLTNRDGSSSATMSKRERAIAAMEGRLYK